MNCEQYNNYKRNTVLLSSSQCNNFTCWENRSGWLVLLDFTHISFSHLFDISTQKRSVTNSTLFQFNKCWQHWFFKKMGRFDTYLLCWFQVLNLKEVSPDVWQRIDLLMDHNETMKDDESSVWQSQVVEMILNSGLKNWTRKDIFRAVGIVNTNAVSCGLANGTALYTSFSFLSHRYVCLKFTWIWF